MDRLKGLGRPLLIREVLLGVCLFELGLGVSVSLYFSLETYAERLAVDLDPGIVGAFHVWLWFIFATSVVFAGIGFVAAESVMRSQGWRARAGVGILAGVLFGLGWAVAVALGSLSSALTPNLGIVGFLLVCFYLVAGPVVAFVALARLFNALRSRQRATAS